MVFTLKFTGDGLPKMEEAIKRLGSESKAKAAYRMALNDTNKAIHTRVKRVLSEQMGASQRDIVKHGGIKMIRAINSRLEASIVAKGGYMPLSDFKSRQVKRGVSAAPWGTRRIFPKTFIVRSLGGNAFKRLGAKRLPIEKLWGPAVPREMVRDQSAKAFEEVSARMLPTEVRRQIERLTLGAVS